MAGTMLIGYDVEAAADNPITGPFLTRARAIHDALGVPATLFIIGQTLERWVPAFQTIARDPLFDLQQHTYSHQLLKTIHINNGTTTRLVRGATLPRIREEVRKTSDALRTQLGVECIGITGPWCYYCGLRDHPDILEILWAEGIRFTRTDGRNAEDYHPVSLALQPYWYDDQGFADILEIPIHGWHDCVIRREVLGWDDLDGYVASVTPYIDAVATDDTVFSLCQHDWSSPRNDPEMRATEAILRHARDRGVRLMTYRAYYEEARDQRLREGIARVEATAGA